MRARAQASIASAASRVRPLPALLMVAALLPAGEAGAAEGLNLFPHFDWLAVHLVILFLLIFPVRRWLLEPLTRVLQERESRTSGAVAEAKQLRDEATELADQIETELRQARSEAQRARSATLAEAEASERSILDLARSESAKAVSEVRDRIRQELDSARQILETQSESLAREAASRILGRAL